MSSLLFALNAVMPIILMVSVGYFLKKVSLVKEDMAKGINKLVFKVFLPAMLFLNAYKIESFSQIDISYIIYAVGFIIALFIIFIPIVIFTVKDRRQRGVLIQAVFRSNFTLVGVPLAESLFGTEGAIIASMLAAFIVPLFNILAVIALSIFSEEHKVSIKDIILGIIKNPLIDAIVLGFLCVGIRALFVNVGIDFRLSDITPVYKVIEYLSAVATPLALIVLGAQFEFSETSTLKKPLIFGVVVRCAVVPVLGIGIAYLLKLWNGAHFAAFMGVFTTPVAVSTVPMAQEMGGDSTLAGQLVVYTTIFSALTVFLGAFLLKEVGIFV